MLFLKWQRSILLCLNFIFYNFSLFSAKPRRPSFPDFPESVAYILKNNKRKGTVCRLRYNSYTIVGSSAKFTNWTKKQEREGEGEGGKKVTFLLITCWRLVRLVSK